MLRDVDVLIINHGVNLRGNQTFSKFNKSIKINALTIWKLIDIFENLSKKIFRFLLKRKYRVNTSESEMIPSLSYSYEISKRINRSTGL